MWLAEYSESHYWLPVQLLEETLPVIMSQYVPEGSDVLKVAVQLESALLMATNPIEP